jgi:hypothetical protein
LFSFELSAQCYLVTETWKCSRCGEVHSGIPGYGFDAPWPWYTATEGERSSSLLAEDHCILRGEDYFIRGCIEIPVTGENDPFIWGVWVLLSPDNFKREQNLRDDPKRTEESPYFGWLSSRIQVYPDTLLLKAESIRVVWVWHRLLSLNL